MQAAGRGVGDPERLQLRVVDAVPPADVDGGLPGAPRRGDGALAEGVHWGREKEEEAVPEACELLGPRGGSDPRRRAPRGDRPLETGRTRTQGAPGCPAGLPMRAGPSLQPPTRTLRRCTDVVRSVVIVTVWSQEVRGRPPGRDAATCPAGHPQCLERCLMMVCRRIPCSRRPSPSPRGLTDDSTSGPA